ncbi:MAG: hypothetical protein WBF40_01540 [Methyloceanibacter sp.]|jgi:hypothetical protein
MRLILGLLLAAALSLPIGLGMSEIASLLPCRGEGLACNLDQAIGGYAVIIWSLLGPVIFGVILLVASNRIALRAGMLLLLAPLVAFLSIALVESWQAFGLEPYENLRTTLTLFVPAALAVLAQWKILSVVLARSQAQGVKPPTTE